MKHTTLLKTMSFVFLLLIVSGCDDTPKLSSGLSTAGTLTPAGETLGNESSVFGGSGRIAGEAGGQEGTESPFGEEGQEGVEERVIVDPTLDTDSDEIFDINDNCPGISNSGQEDYDTDGVGNVCDTDLDGDGMENIDDCAPFDSKVHGNAKEKCNGIDDNCNDIIDEDPDDDCVVFYPDNDGDGSGALGEGVCLCDATAQYPTPFGGDCNDSSPQISSFVEETCDNQDNNCNDLVDEGCDDDSDGYCDLAMTVVGSPSICVNGTGDCVDFSADIYPGAEEISGDGFDNDCDGTALGDGGETLVVNCPDDCLAVGDPVDSYLCALGMCFDAYIQSAAFESPSGDNISSAHAVVTRFGTNNNDLAPFEGSTYGLLSTGPATGTSHSTDLSGGSSIPDPFSSDGYPTYDNAEFTVSIVAPPNAVGFSIDYVFFSEEYEEYIGTSFNDKFYIFLTASQTTGNQKKVINTTQCSAPNTYYDIEENGQKSCYIAINTAFSETCPNVPTNIQGTGFECAPNFGFDSSSTGSSTGWLTTSWPIVGNESFTITFHIHDASDGIFDSEVILDNFRFETVPGSFSQGTTTAN